MARLVSKTMSALLLILLVGSRVAAFCPGSPNQRGQSAVTTATTTLFGIAEWRDTDFDLPGARDRPLGLASSATTPPRPVCLLPFPYSQVLLQGETKQLRLYEDRFLQLFQTVREKHCGVVAMGLLADTGIIQTVPLCEVEASTGSLGEGLGIFVTIRVVGRAQLLEVTKSEPYIQAVCVEVTDAVPAHLELPNLVAANVENYVLLLSSMEHRLNEARLEQGLEDKEMERRIAVAKMEDRFYMADEEEENEDDDDDESDDDDEDTAEEKEVYMDRLGRFQKAYDTALATDTQGYRIRDDTSRTTAADRTAQELTAMSWAAFCTDLLPEEESTYRIQALDVDALFDRLKLASQMLREKKASLRVQMRKAGIKFRGEDLDEDEPTLDQEQDE